MDGHAFDTIVRERTTGAGVTGRRHVVGLLLALLAALTGARAAPAPATAARRRRRTQRARRDRVRAASRVQPEKKKKKKKCPPCKRRAKGKCKGRLPDGAACPGGACQSGACVPPTPDCRCDGRECGPNACGQSCGPCPSDRVCQDGRCLLACAPGLTPCGSECVDLRSDRFNCGACGADCAFPHALATCEAGECQMGACDTGYAECDNDPETGCETNLRTDPADCGACGHVCPENSPQCHNGDCVCPGSGETCSATATCCEDGCRELDRNAANCGACGHACPAGQRCWNSVCVCGDVCPSGCQFTSIQAAADAALPHATVRVCAGTYAGPVVIGKHLSLVGDGAEQTIIDGQESVRPLEIAEGKTVTISHLTVTRGSAPSGGGVLNRGFLTAEDAHVIANISTGLDNGLGPGGGIRNALGSTLSLARCTISDNQASEGGAISGPFTGGISATLTVTDCLIEGNVGGGIDYGSNGTLTVRGCTIQGNGFTSLSCAGVTSSGALATYVIEDTGIIGNDSPVAGGLELTGSGAITNCTITGNTAGNSGGGGLIEGVVTLTGCTVSGNSVVGNGGGLYLHGEATLKDCTITGNTALYNGGGIEAQGGPIVLRNTQVTLNEATNGSGGGIYTAIAISLQDGSVVAQNTPDDCAGGGSC